MSVLTWTAEEERESRIATASLSAYFGWTRIDGVAVQREILLNITVRRAELEVKQGRRAAR